jgi:uncharacterized SAM-binding protein YcdF (DUF218 family)
MNMGKAISAEEAAHITAYLDVEAPPPPVPSAHIIFGTNQATPAELVAERYHRGLAPFVILTGGVNRHTGILEAIEHAAVLRTHGVPEASIRHEASSTTTQGNVAQALPFLREALHSHLVVTAVCKWYHRRAIQQLRALLPEAPFFHAVTWGPVYDSLPVTRSDWWFTSPGGSTTHSQGVARHSRTTGGRIHPGSRAY